MAPYVTTLIPFLKWITKLSKMCHMNDIVFNKRSVQTSEVEITDFQVAVGLFMEIWTADTSKLWQLRPEQINMFILVMTNLWPCYYCLLCEVSAIFWLSLFWFYGPHLYFLISTFFQMWQHVEPDKLHYFKRFNMSVLGLQLVAPHLHNQIIS